MCGSLAELCRLRSGGSRPPQHPNPDSQSLQQAEEPATATRAMPTGPTPEGRGAYQGIVLGLGLSCVTCFSHLPRGLPSHPAASHSRSDLPDNRASVWVQRRDSGFPARGGE